MEIGDFGRPLLIFGLVLAILGVLLMLGGRLPFLGRLPGDLSFRWDGGSLYFPIVTCLIVSILLTIGLNVLLRFFNRP